MGLLVSYFRRPKDSVAELESIEAQLNRLEALRQNQLRLQKRLLGYLLIAFLIGYPVSLAVYYVYGPPVVSKLTRLLHVAAFLAVLPLFYALRRCLLWMFVRSLTSCEARSRRLREDRTKVLDRVMETETYKRAKEILDRFDPDRFKAEFQQQPQQQTPPQQVVKPGQFFAKSSLSKRSPAQQQQQQQQQQRPPPPQPPQGVVLRQLSAVPHPQHPQQPLPQQQQPQQQQQQRPHPAPQLPRPVLSRDRSVVDRLIDMLVGDGPDRRFALICRRCCGHNGMAMAEEFPHLAWRCAYCAYPHSPREPLPSPPTLPAGPQPLPLPPPHPQSPAGRPQWQSLNDLRPTAPSAGIAGSASLHSSSSSVGSSAASIPSAVSAEAAQTATPTKPANENGVKDGESGTEPEDAADVSDTEAVAEVSGGDTAASVRPQQVRRRVPPPAADSADS